MEIYWILNKHKSGKYLPKPLQHFSSPNYFEHTEKIFVCLCFLGEGRERKEARLKARGEDDVFEITFPGHMTQSNLKCCFHLPSILLSQCIKEISQATQYPNVKPKVSVILKINMSTRDKRAHARTALPNLSPCYLFRCCFSAHIDLKSVGLAFNRHCSWPLRIVTHCFLATVLQLNSNFWGSRDTTAHVPMGLPQVCYPLFPQWSCCSHWHMLVEIPCTAL